MNIRKRLSIFAVVLASGGTCLQFGGCSPLSTLGSFVNQFNPCGTLLDCNYNVYEFARSGIDGPGVQPDIDPFCVYPPFCTSAQDPLYGLLGGG